MKPNDLQRYFGDDGGGMPALGRTLEILRGVELIPQRDAERLTEELYGDDPCSFTLGRLTLAPQALLHNLMFLGSPGFGKTTLMNQVKKQTLALHGKGHGFRHFIWDKKGEERLYLGPYDIKCSVDYINPFLEHGVGIDIAKQLGTSYAAAVQFAKDMIAPDAKEGTNMEWIRAARRVFAEVVKIFMTVAPCRWRLIDVLEACLIPANLTRVLSKSRVGQSLLQGMLGNSKQKEGVLLTLQGAAGDMWPLAAAMAHSRNISQREWAYGHESVVVLEHMEEYSDALRPFQRWVFGQAVDLAIAASDAQKTTLFYLDEVRHGPFDEHLMKLLTVGRGKRIGTVVGLTDISGLRDLLNNDQAEEVLGSFSTMVLLGNNNPRTADWVSERIGSNVQLVPEATASLTTSTEGAEKSYEDSLHNYIYPEFTPTGQSMGRLLDTPGARRSVFGDSIATPQERELYEKHGITPARFNKERPTPKSQTLNVTLREVERRVVTTTDVMYGLRAEKIVGKGLTVAAHVISAFIGKPTQLVVSEMDHPEVTLIPADPGELPRVERPREELDFHGWTPADRERLQIPPPPPKKPKRRRRRMGEME